MRVTNVTKVVVLFGILLFMSKHVVKPVYQHGVRPATKVVLHSAKKVLI